MQKAGLSVAGWRALVVHRIGRRTTGSTSVLARLAHRLAWFGTRFVRNVHGIELPFSVPVGRRVRLAHQGMIVVNESSSIGNDCLIRHGVTLGINDQKGDGAPKLGDFVEIGPNAVLLGDIEIGPGSLIGPLALVIDDVPAGMRVLAPVSTVRPPRTAELDAPQGDPCRGFSPGGPLPAVSQSL